MSQSQFTDIARARLRGAGISDAESASLIGRATQIVEHMAALAALDAELPEPSLTFEPVSRPPAAEAR